MLKFHNFPIHKWSGDSVEDITDKVFEDSKKLNNKEGNKMNSKQERTFEHRGFTVRFAKAHDRFGLEYRSQMKVTIEGESGNDYCLFTSWSKQKEALVDIDKWIDQGAVPKRGPCLNPNHPHACCRLPFVFQMNEKEFGTEAALAIAGLKTPPTNNKGAS